MFIQKFSFGKFSTNFLGSEYPGRSWFWFKCSRRAFRGDVCVINGLKNLKDFRGEITLLNIENSPGPNHRKRRILRGNPIWIYCFLSRVWLLEHWVRRLQLLIRKLGKRMQKCYIWSGPAGPLRLHIKSSGPAQCTLSGPTMNSVHSILIYDDDNLDNCIIYNDRD